MSVEPVILEARAIQIAIEFARTNGLLSSECVWVRHISDADYFREVGVDNGYGEYMVTLTGADSGQRSKQKEPAAMTVLINDQTGDASQFFRL